MIHDHTMPAYRLRLQRGGANAYNGALYYSMEIVRNIIPNVETSRPWVTVNQRGECEDNAIVFVHNNLHPENYEWLSAYRGLVLVCGIPETVPKVEHLGTAVYLPLSIDVAETMSHARPKTKGACVAGRPSKVRGVPGVDVITGLPRREFLRAIAEYERVYAVGRTAIEAKALGCEIMPYDPRFPDPSIWKVRDNREAAAELQRILDGLGEA